MADFHVFLSAVSSEFGSARDTLAASLRSRDLLLRVQSDFHQEAAADTTLRKLHDYIRDCSAVVCIIGQRSGAMPPAASAAPFAHMLPPGVAQASYTSPATIGAGCRSISPPTPGPPIGWRYPTTAPTCKPR